MMEISEYVTYFKKISKVTTSFFQLEKLWKYLACLEIKIFALNKSELNCKVSHIAF